MLGPARFAVGEPFAGGLEAHTLTLARALRRRGHEVTLFAGPGDSAPPPDFPVTPIIERSLEIDASERSDTSMPVSAVAQLDVGHRRVLEQVTMPGRFDAVHNNTLHELPASHDYGPLGVLHVLHCPPIAEVDAAHRARQVDPRDSHEVVAVSAPLARRWRPVRSRPVWNGVEVEVWSPGDHAAGEGCAWAGRIVSEKAPHVAIDAARLAGRSIDLAGPIQEPVYFEREVRPRLGPDVRYLGHLGSHELVELYATAAVGVVAPCWEEPFGLVAAEMLACGTPVAAFARGVLPDVITSDVGAIAEGDDAAALAAAIEVAAAADRRRCREHAVATLSIDVMVDAYEALYERSRVRSLVAPGAWSGVAG